MDLRKRVHLAFQLAAYILRWQKDLFQANELLDSHDMLEFSPFFF